MRSTNVGDLVSRGADQNDPCFPGVNHYSGSIAGDVGLQPAGRPAHLSGVNPTCKGERSMLKLNPDERLLVESSVATTAAVSAERFSGEQLREGLS